MAKSSDNVFCAEFKKMMFDRLNCYGYDERFSLTGIELPVLDTLNVTDNSCPCMVRGISADYFSKLNDDIVNLEVRQSWDKRKFDSSGNFISNKDGTYATVHITVPKDSAVVRSRISIGVPNMVNINGVYRRYNQPDGFKYIDFEDIDGVRYFYYYIPKENIYKLNLCALVLTTSQLKRYYRGIKVALQNGTYMYLYVIDYNPRKQMSYRVASIKASPNFDMEIDSILNLWLNNLFIFNRDDTMIDSRSLAYDYMDGVCLEEDFVPYDKSYNGVDSEELIS